MIAAFTYNDYYCYGLEKSRAGIFEDREDALKWVLGGRHERQNLELFDMTTGGVERYKWVPLYEEGKVTYLNKEDPTSRDQTLTLTHRWDKSKPQIVMKWDGRWNGRYGHDEIYYRAGEWEKV